MLNEAPVARLVAAEAVGNTAGTVFFPCHFPLRASFTLYIPLCIIRTHFQQDMNHSNYA
jgi:Zn-finger protein